jgi:hypothetical protein
MLPFHLPDIPLLNKSFPAFSPFTSFCILWGEWADLTCWKSQSALCSRTPILGLKHLKKKKICKWQLLFLFFLLNERRQC